MTAKLVASDPAFHQKPVRRLLDHIGRDGVAMAVLGIWLGHDAVHESLLAIGRL